MPQFNLLEKGRSAMKPSFHELRSSTAATLLFGVALNIASLPATGQSRVGVLDRFADTASYPDDGNQRYAVRARLPDQRRIDVQLQHRVTHIVGIASQDSPGGPASELSFLVTLADGARVWLRVDAKGDASVRAARGPRPADRFPTVLDGGPSIGAETATSEVARVLGRDGGPRLELVDNELALVDSGRRHVLMTDAVHDARLHLDGRGRLLVLSKPSTRYGHAILGDNVEAEAVTIVSLTNPQRKQQYPIGGFDVIEGRGAIWYDWGGTGEREIVVTAANDNLGARLVLLSPEGKVLAQSQTLGTGFRWRHMIGIARTGTEPREELVDVRTPHIGGTVSFYAWHGTALEEIASKSGYTSHLIGSAVLSMANLLNLDDDAAFEVLVPAQNRARLAALKRTGDVVSEIWSVPLTDRVTSNVAIVNVDGKAAVALGGERGLVSIWLP
jgi:hypothetical protein